MAAKYETITLDQVAQEVSDMVHECPALEPGNEGRAVVIESSTGKPAIVDGFHRVGGYCAWATEQEIDYAEVEITVLLADDDDLIVAAAEQAD